MDTKRKITGSFGQSITLKAIIVGFLTLILLIPGFMIQDLILERQNRSRETIEKINAKWSLAQTLCAPILCVPYSVTYPGVNEKPVVEHHVLHITPEMLHVRATLLPEERHYGIYQTILYKSEQELSGEFSLKELPSLEHATVYWDKSYIRMGFSDLRGITSPILFELADKSFEAEASGSQEAHVGKELVVALGGDVVKLSAHLLPFRCRFSLNGSSSISYIPIGQTTHVEVAGNWKAPGYIGNFSPEHTLDNQGFHATWDVLKFNRNIPEMWIDNQVDSFTDSSFGVSLVETVDHYQQNMRSTKYAIMFIALTFIVFFFVEVLTKKRIHPIQYLLVGIALILFYSLLLSISEQLNFGMAYLIASMATIALVTAYTQSIFRDKTQTGVLTFVLCLLYAFLYMVLQLEDIALLVGSIGLFLILAIIMYFSRKVNWYKQEEADE